MLLTTLLFMKESLNIRANNKLLLAVEARVNVEISVILSSN